LELTGLDATDADTDEDVADDEPGEEEDNE